MDLARARARKSLGGRAIGGALMVLLAPAAALPPPPPARRPSLRLHFPLQGTSPMRPTRAIQR